MFGFRDEITVRLRLLTAAMANRKEERIRGGGALYV